MESQQPTAKSQQPTAKGQQPTAKGQQPKANSQQPRANSQKSFTLPPVRQLWVTAVKALGGVDESFGDVPQKLLSEQNTVLTIKRDCKK